MGEQKYLFSSILFVIAASFLFLFIYFNFSSRYSTLLNLPPLGILCVGAGAEIEPRDIPTRLDLILFSYSQKGTILCA
jgi:hypothetical protein